MRLFPERLTFLHAKLNPAEFFAYTKLLCEFVLRDGDLPDNDKQLALLSGMPLRKWLALREKLITLKVSGAEDGRWLDPDQEANLKSYHKSSDAGRGNSNTRWDRVREE